MHDHLPCEQTCQQPCHTTCPPDCAGPTADGLTLAQILERFEREAGRGQLDTGRYRMPYWSWGEGPPLLFLHGLGDDSRAFVAPVAILSKGFRCIAYDFPTGRDDGAGLRRCTHSSLVEDLWALLDHLRLKQCYVFASSFGATVALAAMHARPQRLPRAVLHAAVAHRRLTRRERFAFWLMSHWPGSMRSFPFRRKVLTARHHGPFAGRPPEVWEHFLDGTGTLPVRAVGRRARLLNEVDLRPLLESVRQPVLLVCGDRDPVAPPAASGELLNALPSAGQVVLDGCGHFPNYTHPEALAELVRQFLTPPVPADGKCSLPIADCKVT